ncbi:MAG: Eco57I restriction-modification methylase domain-containing protein, partial [Spirochaetaceae bacterium]
MSSAADTGLTAVTVEGGLLSTSVLSSLARRDGSLSHLGPESYEVDPGMSLGEAITRSWNRVLAAWRRFRSEQEDRGSIGAGRTRQLLLQVLLEELRFGRPPRVGGVTVDGTHYAVTHMWEHVPIHLLAPDVPLDRRTEGVAGAARASPHTLVQEFLNASEDHLWGILSNGRKLRLLRDNRSITRTPYVEFDLEAVFDGELFSDFAVLWLLCHQSRFDAPEPGRAVIEAWRTQGIQSGERALSDLRRGVEEAISTLGEGFLAHPANEALRRELRDGGLSAEEYYREILRLVYRLIFLFVAEDRNVLLRPDADAAARRFYLEHYSTRRLRRLAEEIRGTHHADLFEQLKVVMRLLHRDGSEALALPALGSYLWSPEALGELDACRIENAAFLDAVRRLAFTEKGRMRWRTDFRSLGSEELGSVYESLLELRPEINTISHHFSLGTAAGNERKTTGSYYTPHVLVEKLLDTALDPVIDRAAREANPVEAIRSLKVVDPATGSGHFLVAAAQRIGKRLAAVRTGEAEPAPEEVRRGVREAINHCIYGVDINPMAVELCKVSLWMEALEPGKPLSFLDHHIKVGNSLFGATPELLAGGIPDDAFSVLTLDEKGAASAARKRNRQERTGERSLFNVAAAVREDLSATATRLARLNAGAEENLADVEALSASYEEVLSSDAYRREKLTADAWCAAFVWPKRKGAPEAVTEEYFRSLATGEDALSADQRRTVEGLAAEYRFFHWHLAFPDVFLREDEERQGFDCVLGNPPWERVKLQEQEWFAQRDPDIAAAPNADARKKLIAELTGGNPGLHEEFLRARRHAEGIAHFLHASGRYPLCGRGDINTYSVFTEHGRDAAAPAGRTGMVVPSGVASDDTTRYFFADIVERRNLASLYDFENKGIFPGVHSSYKFCLLTLSGGDLGEGHHARFVFFAHDVADLDDTERQIELSREDFLRINPNTRTAPIFRSRRDAEITRRIYERVPVLIDENREDGNPWGVSFMAMFHMANDSGLFRTRAQLEQDGYRLEANVFRKEGADEYLPLYEAKMIHIFDHRWATHDGTEFRDVSEAQKRDPHFAPLPRYWVPASEVDARLGGSGGRSGRGAWERGWLMGWRDICRSTDERTTIASVVPRVGVGHTMPLVFLQGVGAARSAAFLASISSLPFDFVTRLKTGGTHLTYSYLKQLPVPLSSVFEALARWDPAKPRLGEWTLRRVLELLYVSPELAAFAGDLDFDGPPFRWDPKRRFIIRCELDAAFFHLYGIERDDVDYIME